MQIFLHRYSLVRKKTNQTQEGCLIKIVDLQGNFGVADICPWPHLGDATLDEELENRGPLFQRALELAQKDLTARKNKITLNNNVPVKNHWLMISSQDPIQGDLVKTKCDQNTLNLIQSKDLKFRLDFNGSLTEKEYFDFINQLSAQDQQKIECVEDPFAFNESAWKKSPVKIASDFLPVKNWPWKVIKPARQEIKEDFLYLTSSMDHPIGVAHGLIEAQRYPDKVHGFLTLDLYEQTPFHKYFKQDGANLSYKSDGYGVGFESELNQLTWEPLVNFKSDSSSENFSNLIELQISQKGYFLIPSSGSSHQENQSLKVYAISKAHFLNSAERVNMQYNLTKDMNWGCVLPTYHVGGLSILARAHLAHSKVFFSAWKDFSTEWIKKNNIQLISLVPTQLYDLVQKNMRAPLEIKYVFIGGSHLNSDLEAQARNLGWPLIVTFGMTETSSMIASREGDEYRPFEGVEIQKTKDDRLKIRCNSLAEYCLQMIDGQIEQKNLIQNGFYESEDQIELTEKGFRFLNRINDQIKINGEGVSLFQLRQKLEKILLELEIPVNQAALISVPDERRGESLVLVTQSNIKNQDDIKNRFNRSVQPYERISEIHRLQSSLPVTELNKIKYQQLKETVIKERQ